MADDYLGDMDLPSSESESEDEAPSTRMEEANKKETIRMAQVTHATASFTSKSNLRVRRKAVSFTAGMHQCHPAYWCQACSLGVQTTVREQKKLAEKERKLLEKSHQMKEAALRDDDNVFDVSYENQGDNTTDVVSATDIKVCLSPGQ